MLTSVLKCWGVMGVYGVGFEDAIMVSPVSYHGKSRIISWGLTVWIMSQEKYLIGRPYVLMIFVSLPMIFHVIICLIKTSNMR